MVNSFCVQGGLETSIVLLYPVYPKPQYLVWLVQPQSLDCHFPSRPGNDPDTRWRYTTVTPTPSVFKLFAWAIERQTRNRAQHRTVYH